MFENANNYCLILAGGKGRRLWPCSRQDSPKQFVDFFSTGRTLLQQTYDRMAAFIPAENILVSTNKAFAAIVEEQLPQIPETNILKEPIHRNTAPCVAWAVCRITRRNPEARLIVVPSDQAVFKEDVFRNNILAAADIADSSNRILTMGVKPTRPETGYGYIQTGEPGKQKNIFNVKSFTEKPDRDFARIFMQSGEFYWNTGLFIAKVSQFSECFKTIFPPVSNKPDKAGTALQDADEEQAFANDNYSLYPNLSIDYSVLEKSDNVLMMSCDFGWADLGTWHSIYESISGDNNGNVIIGSNVIADDCRNNIIKLPADHLGIINGLEGCVVAEKDNVILICKKDESAALIRKYINEVQVKYGEKFI